MPVITEGFKQALANLPPSELHKIIIKFARKNREFYDYINLEYLVKKEAETDLFEETKEAVFSALYSNYRGNLQKQLKSGIDKAVKHINYFAKVTKNKKLEADLLLMMLDYIFDNFSQHLGTCFTVFDSRLAITTNRLYNLVTKKLHEDYIIEYEDDINRFLEILHSRSNHLDYVFSMPKKVTKVRV